MEGLVLRQCTRSSLGVWESLHWLSLSATRVDTWCKCSGFDLVRTIKDVELGTIGYLQFHHVEYGDGNLLLQYWLIVICFQISTYLHYSENSPLYHCPSQHQTSQLLHPSCFSSNFGPDLSTHAHAKRTHGVDLALHIRHFFLPNRSSTNSLSQTERMWKKDLNQSARMEFSQKSRNLQPVWSKVQTFGQHLGHTCSSLTPRPAPAIPAMARSKTCITHLREINKKKTPEHVPKSMGNSGCSWIHMYIYIYIYVYIWARSPDPHTPPPPPQWYPPPTPNLPHPPKT